jgi:hypothetical protein
MFVAITFQCLYFYLKHFSLFYLLSKVAPPPRRRRCGSVLFRSPFAKSIINQPTTTNNLFNQHPANPNARGHQ